MGILLVVVSDLSTKDDEKLYKGRDLKLYHLLLCELPPTVTAALAASSNYLLGFLFQNFVL
jgi:hypothetical protein